jgi:glutamate 5-kinase
MNQHGKNRGRGRSWVVKIGSTLLTNEGRGLDREYIRVFVDQVARLRARGIDVVLVSSGSIAEGLSRLALKKRPEALYELQALAAVGQMGLIQVYESCFQEHGTHTAQVLLTHEDVAHRGRYLNARSTLRTLLRFSVVPVVNENDTVATQEIQLGDNDTLAGMVANLIEAELLVILTDQAGLYTADPRTDPAASLVREGHAGDAALKAMAGAGGALGRGGMKTKLYAAGLAARSGTATRIVSGREPDVLSRLANGEAIGTLLRPRSSRLAARKQWLAGLQAVGRLRLDEGACRVLREAGRSLLAVGVCGVEGEFSRGGIVSCFDPDGREIARGMVNYDAAETRKIMGHPSSRIAELLGYVDEPELIHRDNLVVMD